MKSSGTHDLMVLLRVNEIHYYSVPVDLAELLPHVVAGRHGGPVERQAYGFEVFEAKA